MCARGSSICSCLCSCLQATEKEKTRFSLLFFFGDWKTKKTPKKMASSMRRIPPTQGKGGVTGRPKGGDRNWNPAGASGSQAWTQGGHGRGDWYQHRGSDPSVVPPPPGLTPRYGESWPHRPTRPSFTPRGERDTDRRQSHREPRRRGSDDRTRRPERKPSGRRSKEGHRTRSRRYQDHKKKTRGQKEEEEGFAHGFDVEFEREGEISVQHVQTNDVFGEIGRCETDDSASGPHGDRPKGIQPKAQGISGFRKCCTSIHRGCSLDKKGESRRI